MQSHLQSLGRTLKASSEGLLGIAGWASRALLALLSIWFLPLCDVEAQSCTATAPTFTLVGGGGSSGASCIYQYRGYYTKPIGADCVLYLGGSCGNADCTIYTYTGTAGKGNGSGGSYFPIVWERNGNEINTVAVMGYIPACNLHIGRDLIRGHIRAISNTPAKVHFRLRTRTVAVGVRGVLPGTVDLFRYSQPGETYRWRRAETDTLVADGPQPSGSTVTGANTAAMTISAIDAPDEGLYILEVAAGDGIYYMADSVRVYIDRPVADIVQMPQDREACLGGSTEFLAIAVEAANTTYRWFRDGVGLTDGAIAGIGLVSGTQTPLLTIDGLESTAAGNYSCQILSNIYSNYTFDAVLTISNNTTSPIILNHPENVSTSTGSSAYMTADIDVSDGQMPSFQWRKNGIPIYDDGRIEGTETEHLVFFSVIADDVGSYDCIITRGCASITTAAATLTLACPADYNGFGDAGDILDFLDFFQDFGTCDQQPAPCGTLGNPDLNGDTLIDILDFLDFLDAFGTGC